ncbi:hypothetical protein B0H19DRAFT_426623 [Mycena capillaripes]|nr:hypothetical protein B0H19DRAFT_426623 [Mycena capillaripes]
MRCAWLRPRLPNVPVPFPRRCVPGQRKCLSLCGCGREPHPDRSRGQKWPYQRRAQRGSSTSGSVKTGCARAKSRTVRPHEQHTPPHLFASPLCGPSRRRSQPHFAWRMCCSLISVLLPPRRTPWVHDKDDDKDTEERRRMHQDTASIVVPGVRKENSKSFLGVSEGGWPRSRALISSRYPIPGTRTTRPQSYLTFPHKLRMYSRMRAT